jgi:hypothetical protein
VVFILYYELIDTSTNKRGLNVKLLSKTPYTLPFTEAERGKTAYVALAWQNGRGIIGAWSAIKSAIIP